MRKLLVLAVVAVFLAGFSTVEAGDASLRVGGSMIFDGSVFGAAGAVDIGIGDRPIAISPFLEWYKDSGVTTIEAGADVLYKAPVAEGKADVYIGAGAGLIRFSASGLDSESALLIEGKAGVDYGITDKIGIFVEGKYIYASKDDAGVKVIDVSDVSAAVGISFALGGN